MNIETQAIHAGFQDDPTTRAVAYLYTKPHHIVFVTPSMVQIFLI
jgi:hypothetical protein